MADLIQAAETAVKWKRARDGYHTLKTMSSKGESEYQNSVKEYQGMIKGVMNKFSLEVVPAVLWMQKNLTIESEFTLLALLASAYELQLGNDFTLTTATTTTTTQYMDMIHVNFPTGIKERELTNHLTLLNAIFGDTVPAFDSRMKISAVKECQNRAIDTAEKLRQVENSSIGHVMRERMEQYEKHPYSIPYDLEHNGGGQLIQAAIAVASNNPALVPTEWKDKGIMQNVFAKEAYGRLTVACALLIAHMDLIRIQNAQKAGAQVFINGVNSTALVDSMNKD